MAAPRALFPAQEALIESIRTLLLGNEEGLHQLDKILSFNARALFSFPLELLEEYWAPEIATQIAAILRPPAPGGTIDKKSLVSFSSLSLVFLTIFRQQRGKSSAMCSKSTKMRSSWDEKAKEWTSLAEEASKAGFVAVSETLAALGQFIPLNVKKEFDLYAPMSQLLQPLTEKLGLHLWCAPSENDADEMNPDAIISSEDYSVNDRNSTDRIQLSIMDIG